VKNGHLFTSPGISDFDPDMGVFAPHIKTRVPSLGIAAVDDTHVYFSESQAVVRIARP